MINRIRVKKYTHLRNRMNYETLANMMLNTGKENTPIAERRCFNQRWLGVWLNSKANDD